MKKTFLFILLMIISFSGFSQQETTWEYDSELFDRAANAAFNLFVGWFIIYYVYGWAKVLLSLRTEGKEFTHSLFQKIVTFIMSVIGSVIAAAIIYFMFNDSIKGLEALFIFLMCSVFATIKLYKSGLN